MKLIRSTSNKIIKTTFILLLAFTAAFANNTEPKPSADNNVEEIVAVEKDVKDNTLKFTLQKEVFFVQIINPEGKLELQLPVMSSYVVIDLDDYQTGDYQINFLFENEELVSSTFKK
jgi:hypothetical protein